MSKKMIEGIITATVTPMGSDGKLDFSALKELNLFLIEKGVHGLFCCGSTGEGVLLSEVERKQVAEATVRDATGRIPVIVHTGSIHLDEAIRLTLHAKEIGVAAAALIPPYYYGIDNQAIFKYFSTIAEAVPDLYLFAYNIPMNVKNVIAPEMLKELSSRYSNVVGVKDSSMDFMSFINYRQALPDNFCILMGNDAQIYSAILAGGQGAVSATSTVYPEPLVAIWNRLQANDLAGARQAQDVVMKLRTVFRSYPPVASYKKALELRGIHGGFPRRPLRSLTPEEENKLKNDLNAIILALD